MKTFFAILIRHEGDFAEILEKLDLISLFKPIIDHFNVPTARAIIKYILYVYSRESDLMLGKETLEKKKLRCARAAGISEDLIAPVVLLQPKEKDDPIPAMIRTASTKYLNYQDEPRNKDLKSLYDLYNELVDQSAKQPTSNEDYTHKYKCREMANNVRDWIDAREKLYMEEDSNTKAARQELKEKNKANTQAIRPENVANSHH